MAALTIAWEYLTGYAVATDPGNRERAEWPPHPARVFMALAAAWFETDPGGDADDDERRQHQEEGAALRLMEGLDEPELWLPTSPAESERSLVTCYVPVNDKAGPSSATLQSAPALTRTRQARTFPRRHVGATPCALQWPEAEQAEAYREALGRLCTKVTRIGHSSSLVRMWVVDTEDQDELAELERWQPDGDLAHCHCRRIAPGLLDSLPKQTGIPRIEAFAEAVWRIEEAQHAVDAAKIAGDRPAQKAASQDLKQAKRNYEDTFGEPYKKAATPPPRLRPHIGLWSGYRRSNGDQQTTLVHSHFDTDLLILVHDDGPRLPLNVCLSATAALRGKIMKDGLDQPPPAWISGHAKDGSPSANTEGHLALVPLPVVGNRHADGHLLGMALVFPREGVGGDRRERGRALGPLLVDEHGNAKPVELQMGQLGLWTLRKRDWSEPRQGLQAESWTAVPDGATCWASVTPVVLDRFPKTDRSDPKKRPAWEQEVRAIVAEACTRIGLPTPIHIDIDTTSWHRGSPRAVTKRRRLRGASAEEGKGAALGDGFPDYPAKGTNSPRPQVHVFLQFAEAVLGPVLLGAGRYRGYGLCKPLETTR